MTALDHGHANGNGVSTNGNGRRVPPHSVEAEECLLGAMLLSLDARTIGLVLPSGALYLPKHRAIFEAIGQLHERGAPVDPRTVSEALDRAGKLDLVGGRRELGRMMAATPASANTREYAKDVGEYAAFRQAISLGEQFSRAGYGRDVEEVDRLLVEGLDAVIAQLAAVLPPHPPRDVMDMIPRGPERPADFVVGGLLARGDRALLTGGEGSGKTTLLRQIGTQVAAGIHPFTLDEITPRRVVHFDFQDSSDQSDDEFVRLREATRGRLAHGFHRVYERRQGMNLLNRGDLRWFEESVKRSKAELVTFGPLYKTFQAGAGKKKHDEDVAEEVTAHLDRIASENGIAYVIEAHSPHGYDNDRAGWRPYGASLWVRWPEFGFGLKPIPAQAANEEHAARPSPGVFLKRFRLDRVRGRGWPSKLLFGKVWPWEAPPIEVL